MKHLSLLIKPASSLCNMRCHYCFYADVSNLREVHSFGIMQPQTTEKIIENVCADLEPDAEVTFAFQGGEPTMAGLYYFEHFTALAAQYCKQVKVHYALQTNGLLLDDAWCAFLAKHRFLVGLSLDGEPSFHNENRLDTKGKGTYHRVMTAKAYLEKYNVEYNVLWVLTNHHARYPQKVWRFLETHHINHVQFIPCLAELGDENPAPQSLTPQRFASFYTELFGLWAAALEKGEYRSVKLFDDLFNLLTKRVVTACGFTGKCQPQFVLEADGSVYPCDFYVLDEWRIGSMVTQTPTELLKAPNMNRFLTRLRGMPIHCETCYWKNICGGGCVRMRHNMYLDFKEQFCGYKMFLDTNSAKIERIAQQLVWANNFGFAPRNENVLL